jgi:hypothetical protein
LSGTYVALLIFIAMIVWGLTWIVPIVARALRTGVIEGRAGFYDRRANKAMYAWTLGVFVVIGLLFLFTLIVVVPSVLSGRVPVS